MDIYVDYSDREVHAWAAAVKLSSGRLLMLGRPLTPTALRHWDAEEHAYLACAATLRNLGHDPAAATFHSDGVVVCQRHNLVRVSGTHPTHRLAHLMSRRIRKALEGHHVSLPWPVPAPTCPETVPSARRAAYGAALHRLCCRVGTLHEPLNAPAAQRLKTLADTLTRPGAALPEEERLCLELLLTVDVQGMPGIRAWAESLPGEPVPRNPVAGMAPEPDWKAHHARLLHRVRCTAGTLQGPLKTLAGQQLKAMGKQAPTRPAFELLVRLDAQGLPAIRSWAKSLPGIPVQKSK